MTIGIGFVILIAVLALALGLVAGFFLARNSMKNYLAKSAISEKMIESMMMSMGRNHHKVKSNDGSNEATKCSITKKISLVAYFFSDDDCSFGSTYCQSGSISRSN